MICFIIALPYGVINGKLHSYQNDLNFEIPESRTIHGIDLSHHNGDIDWDKLSALNANKSAVKFCFVKATEGTDIIDPKFAEHWMELKNRNIVRGAYHFFNVKSDPRVQALNYINQVKIEPGDMPPVIDFENGVRGSKNKRRLEQRLNTFVGLLEDHYGVKPIIYTNKFLYKEHIETKYIDYPIWISQYNTNSLDGYSDDHLAFWQYSMKGKVEGISSTVDLNVFLGEESDFQNLLHP
jgi:lysozyme